MGVSAGGGHTVLLKSDGHVVACGQNAFGQYTIPDLPDGVTYSQVSAGMLHTLLLKSDGHVVACGQNAFGQCTIPDLSDGVTYLTCTITQFRTYPYHVWSRKRLAFMLRRPVRPVLPSDSPVSPL